MRWGILSSAKQRSFIPIVTINSEHKHWKDNDIGKEIVWHLCVKNRERDTDKKW